MKYGSVCSGIEAATVAWHLLGWKAAFFAETDKFPSKVLKKRFRKVVNHGDFTTIQAEDYGPIDLLVGGTPCQPFSVAGLRKGLADNRGNLTLEFIRLAQRLRPRWLVWENVPGVFSATSHDITDRDQLRITPDGRLVSQRVLADEAHAFSCFLAGLQELGYGFAYRVLDAQHFGVPQRRRRVFVVGHLGDWRRAAAVLFERHSLSGNPAPRREAGKVAPTIPSRRSGGGGLGSDFDFDGGLIANTGVVSTLDASYARLQGCSGQDANHGHSHLVAYGGNNTSGPIDIATALNAYASASGRMDFESEPFVTHSLRAEGFDASEDGTGRGTPLVPVAFDSKRGGEAGSVSPALRSMNHTGSHANAGGQVAVCFDTTQVTSKTNRCNPQSGDPCHPLASGAHPPALAHQMAVRRLTPRECERLQGFPDDYTKISHKTADGPRYKALGNSMAVPVMRWIGERIQMVEGL